MSMDIKDIIKWFIPCFHILLKQKLSKTWIFVCLFLFLNLVASSKINSGVDLSENVNKNLDVTKNVEISFDEGSKLNQSAGFNDEILQVEQPRALGETSVGRTFGRPFKKMMAGLIPVIFQVGAASTWALVAALVGVKTLVVTLFILKLLLIAGAAKIGALFGGKGHQHHGWEPPNQKEIHLHIHNGGHEHHEEHPISWSREGYSTTDSKPVYVYEPYRAAPQPVPQTISTPYGTYMKIDSNPLIGPVTAAGAT